MKLNVQAVNFTIAERLTQYIGKKTKKYEKAFGEDVEMMFRLTVVKPETVQNKETQVRVLGLGQEIFAEKVSDSFEEGIDEALAAVGRQLERLKEKK